MGIAGAVAIWGLVFARVAGVALLMPPMGHPQVPVSLRIAAAALFAVPLMYIVEPAASGTVALADYAARVVANLTIGLVLGAGVAAVMYGAMMAGGYLDTIAGWSAENLSRRPGGRIIFLLATALFVLIDGHHAVLHSLAESLLLMPPMIGDIGRIARQAVIAWPAEMFRSSLLIAAPALLAGLMARAMVAAVERIFEELRDCGMSSGAGSLLAMAVFALTLPAVAWAALGSIRRVLNEIDAFL